MTANKNIKIRGKVQNITNITGVRVNVLTQYGLKCSTYTLLVKLTTELKTNTDLVP